MWYIVKGWILWNTWVVTFQYHKWRHEIISPYKVYANKGMVGFLIYNLPDPDLTPLYPTIQCKHFRWTKLIHLIVVIIVSRNGNTIISFHLCRRTHSAAKLPKQDSDNNNFLRSLQKRKRRCGLSSTILLISNINISLTSKKSLIMNK